MTDAEAAGRALAHRHQPSGPFDPSRSLLNYAESSRDGDWTLRSALVRLAQPEPVRAGAVLELVRRCDGALHPLSRPVERRIVLSQPGLTRASLLGDGGEEPSVDARADGRVTDLARLSAEHPDDTATLLRAYEAEAEQPLDAEEVAAVPLLTVALLLDQLASGLVEWTAGHRDSPPIDDVDRLAAEAFDRLAELDVPREGPPPGSNRGRRRS